MASLFSGETQVVSSRDGNLISSVPVHSFAQFCQEVNYTTDRYALTLVINIIRRVRRVDICCAPNLVSNNPRHRLYQHIIYHFFMRFLPENKFILWLTVLGLLVGYWIVGNLVF